MTCLCNSSRPMNVLAVVVVAVAGVAVLVVVVVGVVLAAAAVAVFVAVVVALVGAVEGLGSRPLSVAVMHWTCFAPVAAWLRDRDSGAPRRHE